MLTFFSKSQVGAGLLPAQFAFGAAAALAVVVQPNAMLVLSHLGEKISGSTFLQNLHSFLKGTQGTKVPKVFYTEFVSSLTALASLSTAEEGIYFTSSTLMPLLRWSR